MRRRDLLLGTAGALVIALASTTLWEIEERAGPHELLLVPAAVEYRAAGSYLAAPPAGPVGSLPCPPGVPPAACAPARLEVSLRLAGLPPVAPASYVAYLAGGSATPLRLGPLVVAGDAHALEYAEDRDARDDEALLVTLERDPGAAVPGPLLVARFDVAGQEGQPVDLAASGPAPTLVAGGGRVRLAEVGAVGKSLVAVGTLEAAVPEGWALRAWTVPDAGPPVGFGLWTPQQGRPGNARLDGRVEHVRIEDQARFLTALEPAGLDDPAGPGFPAFAAAVPR